MSDGGGLDLTLLDLFRQEAGEYVDTLSKGLLAIEQGDAVPSALEPMMRAAHSLKGAARIVGLAAAERLAHALEDVMVASQRGDITLAGHAVDAGLEAVDWLASCASTSNEELPAWAEAEADRADRLAASLRAVAEGRPPTTPVPLPPGEALGTPRAGPPAEPESEPPAPPARADSAEAYLDDLSLLELFRQEAEVYVQTLSEGLVALDLEGAVPSALEPMMRAAHSLKGAARIVGHAAAERLAHALEDVMVASQRGAITLRPEGVDTCLRAVDLLSECGGLDESSFEDWHRSNSGRVDDLESALRAIAEGGEVTPRASPHAGPTSPAAPGADEPEAAAPASPPGSGDATPPVPTATPGVGPPPGKAAPATSPDAVVRVAAGSLTQLLGLAGESLVEVRQLRPLVDALMAVRGHHAGLCESLRKLRRRDAGGADRPGEDLARLEAMGHAQDAADRSLAEVDRVLESLERYARRNEELSERLHHEVIQSRMRPLADGVRGFPRMVRDVARQLGKKVRFEVVGDRTGVDRDILDRLEAPLNHLIRNALDHGLETPEDRVAAGKPAEGAVRLEGRHQAGMLHLTVSDDGRGLDPERLRAKVVERGLAGAAMAAQMTDAELFEFLFLPGFSTKGEVTELSGRGVGLDVVQSMVQSVGGMLQTASTPGKGTQFHLRLPITRSVIRALLVGIGGEPYAVPLNRLDRVVVAAPDELEELEGRPFIRVDDDQPIGLVPAALVLGLGEDPGWPVAGGRSPIVVVADRGQRFGMVVDALIGERDLDIRPLDARLGKVPDVAGASVLDDGRVVLILDVEDLVRSIDARLQGHRFRLAASDARPVEAGGEGPGPKRILVVDDSITVRELERQLLANHGYEVDTAVDGMDGWNALRQGRYDLVVSDVDMPRLDGIGLVRLVRDDPRLRGLPVVIVSYKDRAEDRLRGLDAGADAYLTKGSFHDETFISTVVDLIGEAVRR
ncbi:hybrid sensor histidine kinase/response regulator [Tautonia plasticadhaerens]|uniref:histidine kinase n=1 Tax=Tautonia plasticadhaerens TaxID=2527974 RepID=A0A518GUT4_9BACT|nr:hybrid sensor histidine kinase/response regulator [Tautonia plasticadhaerens]QDV32347.1 Gliding motility regulatory protein [Tautonia plasticadhaerens]